MIGVDTNIWVRYFAKDDPLQSPAAREFLQSHCSEENPAWISLIVLCELVWVLRKSYKLPKADICDIVGLLVKARDVTVESEVCVTSAVQAYADSKADFSDCLIAAVGVQNGVTRTMTFDVAASKVEGFELLPINPTERL